MRRAVWGGPEGLEAMPTKARVWSRDVLSKRAQGRGLPPDPLLPLVFH